VPARWLVEAALLAGVILATLAFTPSDGPQLPSVVDPVPAPATFGHASSSYFAWMGPAVGASSNITVQAPIPVSPPATILIPSLNVHRPVEAVGVDRTGMMYQPENLWNAGWYKGGPVPGAPGDAVIEGHAGYPNAPLLFGKLQQLHAGDKIVVVLADGSRRLFLVASQAIWPAGKTPAGLGEPYGPPRLTLITCTGPFDDHYKTYADRLVVEATYAGLAP
jgi:LPXTG-site transpeptidase (sortase) family protein